MHYFQILRQLTAEATQRSAILSAAAPTGTRVVTGRILDLGTRGMDNEEGQRQVVEMPPEEVQNTPSSACPSLLQSKGEQESVGVWLRP